MPSATGPARDAGRPGRAEVVGHLPVRHDAATSPAPPSWPSRPTTAQELLPRRRRRYTSIDVLGRPRASARSELRDARRGRRCRPATSRSRPVRRPPTRPQRSRRGAGVHQHLPAGLRGVALFVGCVPHPQHVLDAGRPAHPRARAAARDRREPPAGMRSVLVEAARRRARRRGHRARGSASCSPSGLRRSSARRAATSRRRSLVVAAAHRRRRAGRRHRRHARRGLPPGPARRARSPPVAAMRDDVALPTRSLRVAGGRGIVLARLLGAAALARRSGRVGGPAAACALVGVGVAAGVRRRRTAPAQRRPARSSASSARPSGGCSGRSACWPSENARRNPRRTAATASALMIGVALVAAIGDPRGVDDSESTERPSTR